MFVAIFSTALVLIILLGNNTSYSVGLCSEPILWLTTMTT